MKGKLTKQEQIDADVLVAKLTTYSDSPALYSVIKQRTQESIDDFQGGRPTLATLKNVMKRL